jgi:hypothetical protein
MPVAMFERPAMSCAAHPSKVAIRGADAAAREPAARVIDEVMDYATFRASKDKPSGKTSPLSPLSGSFPLAFVDPGDDWPLAFLDDSSSFEDLQGGIGIGESWASDFPRLFPHLEPLAAADLSDVDDIDSYAEFLLLVDTSIPAHPVYWFSAEWWSWDRWNKTKNGFHVLAPSFDVFLASLVDAESASDDGDDDGDDDDDD